MNFKIENIELDTSIQCRATINMETVNDYAERMTEGDEFPPVELYGTKDRAWIGDGWHRVMAAKNIDYKDIPANLHAGGRVDALKAALGANTSNGLRRSNPDKRRCVEIALKEWPNLTNRQIAQMCGVRDPMVAVYRPETSCNNIATEKRTGADGKQYKATHTKPDPAPEIEPEEETEPEPEETRKLGPPSIGMQRVRMAIMDMQEITKRDTERAEAFATMREWLDDNE